MQQWHPMSMAEARDFSMECIGRAGALAEVLADYAWEQAPSKMETMRECLELLDDLCYFGYSPMLDWWDDEKTLIGHGWTPPEEKEDQR
jgi:hypothetical protein